MANCPYDQEQDQDQISDLDLPSFTSKVQHIQCVKVSSDDLECKESLCLEQFA